VKLLSLHDRIRSHIEPFLTALPTTRSKLHFLNVMKSVLETGNTYEIERVLQLKRAPVDCYTFVEDADYLDMKGVLWPKVLQSVVEANEGNYIEFLLTGAIGTGKTTQAVITTAYQLYLLSCYDDPHALFRLDPASEILFIMQSAKKELSTEVDYERFRAMIERSPYFTEEFPFDPSLKSTMKFPNRIVVKPISGESTGALGQNVFGGIIDELNFMAIVKDSRQSRDAKEYDQAKENYRAIVRRRKSRFMREGKLPGLFCLVSSKRYPGEFTDEKLDEVAREIADTGKTSTYVFDYPVWEVKPAGTYTGDTFRVFIGDEQRQPRLLDKDERMSEADEAEGSGMILNVPIEHRPEFENDLLNALRDVAGVSTLAVSPFMPNTEAIVKCFGKVKSILSSPECDFVERHLKFYPSRFREREKPRHIHLDLSLTRDHTGIACGYVPGFAQINRGDDMIELLPIISFDFVLEVSPPKDGEIKYGDIRRLIMKLRDHGLNIRWVSADSFQSVDTLQILRQKGFLTDKISVDLTPVPYQITKTAMYDNRVAAPYAPVCSREFSQLERNPKTGIPDHPPTGSKDMADAVTGVVYGLSVRMETWAMYGIPTSAAPSLLKSVFKEPGQ